VEADGARGALSPDEEREQGGPAAERLREQLKRQFGEVPPESPSEPDEQGEDREHHDDDDKE